MVILVCLRRIISRPIIINSIIEGLTNLFLGVHTNNIEVQWRYAKKFVKTRCINKTSDPAFLQQMLLVYSWHQLAKAYPGGPSLKLLGDIMHTYPVE